MAAGKSKAAPKGKLVVAQSGGPTAVINQSLYGVISEAMRHESVFDGIYGGLNGVEGIMKERFVDLRRESEATLQMMAQTSGAGLGSCRKKPKPEECEQIFEIFRRYDVRYFFYIGGNDSALAAGTINQIARKQNYELRIFHVPKTIDNDLLVTDHCPGYASGAKYVAQCFMGNDADNRSLPGIKIDVCMGRNAGWLTAASALARVHPGDGPHLIYLPERPITLRQFCEQVEAVYKDHKRCLVAVSEGVVGPDGKELIESPAIEQELKDMDMVAVLEWLARFREVRKMTGVKPDDFGHISLSGTGVLADCLASIMGIYLLRKNGKAARVRADTLGYAQRSMLGITSEVDTREAFEAGVAAVRYALRGDIDGSVCFRRLPSDIDKYFGDLFLANLEDVAGVERKKKGLRQYRIMTDPVKEGGAAPNFIAESGNDVTPEFLAWLRPLVGELAPKGLLAFHPVEKKA